MKKNNMDYKPLVYVCSPFSGNVELNIKSARAFSRYAAMKGYIPFTPHLLFPQFLKDEDVLERELAMHFNYVLLGKCDEIWVFGSHISKGMKAELEIAERRKMIIRRFDNSMKEVTA
ncbi:MAG: DUF4406 domain-containing protein [Anaerovoracaceae bacterium]